MFSIIKISGGPGEEPDHASLMACTYLLKYVGLTYQCYVDRVSALRYTRGCIRPDGFVVLDEKRQVIATDCLQLALWIENSGLRPLV